MTCRGRGEGTAENPHHDGRPPAPVVFGHNPASDPLILRNPSRPGPLKPLLKDPSPGPADTPSWPQQTGWSSCRGGEEPQSPAPQTALGLPYERENATETEADPWTRTSLNGCS